MKIITYNVNGLRAAVSKGLPEWLEQEQADVVCIQETKLQPDQYPEEALSTLGSHQHQNNADEAQKDLKARPFFLFLIFLIRLL